ncbi:hypothetical protein B2K_18400 [Paenibacillus mucilaginosus K02]|uniref:Uncharacterized protein n=1 Tax=Paenibacillus mucilaginosus K02 TaxID=997761 RepID=I0BJX1_9BACL|nr:hypothetical protein B2K_18400 [Paenibacillus mucilaginosus K02]
MDCLYGTIPSDFIAERLTDQPERDIRLLIIENRRVVRGVDQPAVIDQLEMRNELGGYVSRGPLYRIKV